MPKAGLNLNLPSVDDLFSTEESRVEDNLSKIRDIPLTDIDDFPNHPFKVNIDEDMEQLVESIKQRGIITPATVRIKEDGRYELVSGHRRKKACELAGLDTLKCEIKELTRDDAVILMVESNLQRSTVLPSEKAFSYKMKLEAMNRQGQRTDLTSRPVVGKSESADIIGEHTGDSGRQIQRYIRLTELISKILQMVDDNKIAFRPAVEISYLSVEQQEWLHETMECEDCTPSLAQAIKMKQFSQENRLSEDVIFSILREEKPNQKEKVALKDERFNKYFPKEYTAQQKEELLANLLEKWYRQQRERDTSR